jgi:hypothetical protein
MDYSLNGVYVDGCTIGFIAEYNGRRGFITNSHCSYKEWGTENTEYHQATFDGGSSVGFEYKDSGGSSCGFLSSRNCRKSDATFAVVNVDAELGTIARTTWVGGPAVPPRAPRRSPPAASKSSFRRRRAPRRAKSWTGRENHGVDHRVGGAELRGGFGFQHEVLRCQHFASYGSGDGDSGSRYSRPSGVTCTSIRTACRCAVSTLGHPGRAVRNLQPDFGD